MNQPQTASPGSTPRGAPGSTPRIAAGRSLRLLAAAVLPLLGLAACNSDATTKIGGNGREIEVTGGGDHAVSSTPAGHVVVVDGLRIEISNDAVTVGGGAPKPLTDDWRRMDVAIEDGDAVISVDGQALD